MTAIRKILKEVELEGERIQTKTMSAFECSKIRNKVISFALSQIKAEIEKMLPKEIEDKEMPEDERKELFDLYKNGYNQCLAEIKQRLRQEAEEKYLMRKPTQQEIIYQYIKSQGRVFTHSLNKFGDDNHINCSGSRARELKAKGLIWRMNENLRKKLYPNSKEEIWSVIKEDLQEPAQEPVYVEKNKQFCFIK